MDIVKTLYDKEWKVKLWLLLCSFFIYFAHFHQVFLHLNSVMSSITGDALKNYYTYAFHIKNDPGLLHFSGMGFPYGEHVVFTDCQPLLTFILKLLPFTHPYLIGILHALIFFSFIVSPIILHAVLQRLGVDRFSSFFLALAINLLSPQFAKINGGHHGLAYGFVIPLCMLLCLQYLQEKNKLQVLKLFAYNFLLFLLHPYLGFGCSLFTFIILLTVDLRHFNYRSLLKTIAAGILPIVFFKIFMQLTDLHKDRTVEPYGSEALVENIDTLLAPDFGPFKALLESIFKNKVIHFEGHSYLGFFVIVCCAVFVLGLPFYFRKIRFRPEASAFLIAAFILLLVSFGLHATLLKALHIKSTALLQFRASCRFAWFFYFALPVFISAVLFRSCSASGDVKKLNTFRFFAVLFFVFNFVEGHSYIEKDKDVFWKSRNLLNEKQLTETEKTLIARIKALKPQAIIPLPVFCVGSEMYDRIGGDNSMIPSMVYSFYANVPILSTWLSRTSISETENALQLLNSYKKRNPAVARLSEQPFLILRTPDDLLPAEERLLSKVKLFDKNDNVKFGTLEQKELLMPDKKEPEMIAGPGITKNRKVVYIPFEDRKPFTETNIKNNDLIFTLDSNKVDTGNYIVSLHYHYSKKIYRSVACDLLITKQTKDEFKWESLRPMSVLSGFYEGFGVLEYKMNVQPDCEYKFAIYGGMDQTYRLSNFMLRSEHINVKAITSKKDTTYNNFPE